MAPDIIDDLHEQTGYAIVTINIVGRSGRADTKKAVIDTGATNTCIDKGLIDRLGLDYLGERESRSVDRVIPNVPYYAGRIEIPKLSLAAWNLDTIQPTTGIPGFYDAVSVTIS